MKFFLTFFSAICTCICFAQIPAHVTSNGLVAYYPFNGNPNDYSGNNNNPTTNTASLTSNRFGESNAAYHFDGFSSYMRIPNSSSLNANNKLSIHIWIRPTGFYSGPCHGNSVIMKGDQDFLTGNYFLRFDDSHLGTNCNSSVNQSQQNYYGPSASNGYTPYVSLEKWCNVVLTYDGNIVRTYINSELISSTTQTISTFTNPYDLFFGRLNSASYPYWFNGDIDEIAIYNRDLSQIEINNLFSGSCTITPPITTNQVICGSRSVNLSAIPQGLNQTINWYATQSGGTPLNTGNGSLNFTTPVLNNTTTYYAQSRDTITGCISNTRSQLTINVYSALVPSTPLSINGPTDICSYVGSNQSSTPVTYNIRRVSNAYSYNWVLPIGATLVSGQGDTSIKVAFDRSFISGSISVSALNACGVSSTVRTLIIYKRSSTTPILQKEFSPVSIPAVTNVCGLSSEIYKIKKVAYATSYAWSLKVGTKATLTHLNGTGINDTVVLITFLSGFTRDTLYVASVTPCSISNARLCNLSSILTPPSITSITANGNNFSPCIGDVVTYSAAASSPSSLQSQIALYKWTIPNYTTILSATNDSSSITLKYNAGFNGGSIIVKGNSACGITGTSKTAVLQYLPPTPTSIISSSGSYNSCIGSQTTYTAYVPAPTSSQRIASVYRWTKPNYTTIISALTDSSSITVKFNSGYSGGIISVKGQTLCGVQSSQKTQQLRHTACPSGSKIYSSIHTNSNLSNKSNFQIYPNPSYEAFHILTFEDNKTENTKINIFDLQGRLIENLVFKPNASISFGQKLSHGVYNIEIINGVNKQFSKIIKY